MIANTPDLKTILKNPTLFVHEIMAFADFRLKEINRKLNFRQKVYIVCGGVGKGKTSCIQTLLHSLNKKNISVSGIYSARILENGETIGYDVVDISTGRTNVFLRKKGDESQKRIGNYYIYNEGFKLGLNALKQNNSRLVIIDEVGRLETSEKGWFKSLSRIIANNENHLIITVRKEFIPSVIKKFKIYPENLFEVSETNCEDISRKILKDLNL